MKQIHPTYVKNAGKERAALQVVGDNHSPICLLVLVVCQPYSQVFVSYTSQLPIGLPASVQLWLLLGILERRFHQHISIVCSLWVYSIYREVYVPFDVTTAAIGARAIGDVSHLHPGLRFMEYGGGRKRQYTRALKHDNYTQYTITLPKDLDGVLRPFFY